MGYSVSVSVRSHKLKEEMYEFLQRLYRPWSEIVAEIEEEPNEHPDFFHGPYIDDELGAGKCILGFEYRPTTGPEREYHYALVRWMALQIGKRRSRFRGDDITFDQPVPYYVFDGVEALPILLASEWPKVPPDLSHFCYDSLGMQVGDHLARELAWYCIPEGSFETVSAIYHGQSSENIKEALIHEGLDGAQFLLHLIRTQIGRLDVLWRGRGT